jgi:Holliday junction resolvase-like predicted endonuclease
VAVGAALVQQPGALFYWCERQAEVDFVYRDRDRLHAIEVKSGRKKSAKGLEAFCQQVPHVVRPAVAALNRD